MHLYLVRHGEAAEPSSDLMDPQRRLTPLGREQAARAAAFLGRLGLSLRAIWHSPLLRAVETAEILARAVHSHQGPVERAGLGPLDPVGPVADEIAALDADLMIVGHEPFLGRLAGRLMVAEMGSGPSCAQHPEGPSRQKGPDPLSAPVACGRAGPVCLERGATGAWVLRWAVRQELLELVPAPPQRAAGKAGAKRRGVGRRASSVKGGRRGGREASRAAKRRKG